MPPRTKNREPAIVYLRREVKIELEEAARREGRTISAMASRIIEEGLDRIDRSQRARKF